MELPEGAEECVHGTAARISRRLKWRLKAISPAPLTYALATIDNAANLGLRL
jgi:hypothetical protein